MLNDLHKDSATSTIGRVRTARHPLIWIPSLYIVMGLPGAVVGVLAVVMFKNLGVPTTEIALYTSQLYLPWALKPLWAPLLERYRTNRYWILAMQFLMAAVFALIVLSLNTTRFFALSLALLWIVSIAAATQDIVIDGLFMNSTSSKEQMRYSSVQAACWNLGSIIVSGGVVSCAGQIHTSLGLSWQYSWTLILFVLALGMVGLGLWHSRVLPDGEPPKLPSQQMGTYKHSIRQSWLSFFSKQHIVLMLVVILFYRFGEGFIDQLGPVFLLESRAKGGLGLSNQTLGMIGGLAGTLALLAGTFAGGMLASRLTLRRSFLILVVSLNLPHFTYFYLSTVLPTDPHWILLLVFLEKFGFGMGSVGHMLYMMQQVAPGPFRMTHYTLATSTIALTRWFTGSISGPIFAYFNCSYSSFFTFVVVVSVPVILLAIFAPFPHREELGHVSYGGFNGKPSAMT
jgi:PAT family beta-lactamase induction signal transducer AmpG